jgi:streptogramin lyase
MRRVSILAVALLAAGCSSHPGAAPTFSSITPQIFQKHVNKLGWIVTQIGPIGGARAEPFGLAVDDNHHVWAAVYPGELVKILMNDRQKTFPTSIVPFFLAFGSDKNMWVTGNNRVTGIGEVARVSPMGLETDYTIGPANMFLGYIVSGPDGDLWFTECSKDEKTGGVVRMDTSGSYTLYPFGCRGVIANGPDGNIWFGDIGQNIYKMDVEGNLLGTYAVGDQQFNGLTAGSDGAMYATAEGNVVNYTDLVRVSTSGVVTHITNDPYIGGLNTILSGPDGNLWISSPRSVFGYFIQFDVATQTWGEIVKGPKGAGEALATGPDGNVWATAPNASSVDTYIIQAMTVTPKELTISVGRHADITLTEANYSGGWTAVATNPGVASVTPKSQSGTFEVTGVSPGTTSVTVYDAMYNSISVKVTVQ